MKTKENKTVSIAGKETTYQELITMCLNNPPEGGFTREEMKSRDRIESQLTVHEDGAFHFEDADYTKLIAIIGLMKWAIRDSQLKQFLIEFES